MPTGPNKTIGVSAVSTWHAINIVFGMNATDQGDMKKYKAKRL